MPKHTRSTSHSHRYANQMPVGVDPSGSMPMYNQRHSLSGMDTAAFYQTAVPSTSAQAAAAMETQAAAAAAAYDPYPGNPTVAVQPPPALPQRASSGAWTPTDDQNLLAARQQGLNWAQIQSTYFPNKSPNACRKRHERLMERKGADDFDQRRMERLAREYMSMRKEIWQPLAARTGDKWNVVEQLCMSNGLKNLQTAARSASRRERLENGQYSGYDDDSGISGIGLTPVDDHLDGGGAASSYHSPGASSSLSAHSSSGRSSNGSHHSYGAQQAHNQMYGMVAANPYATSVPHPGYASSYGSSHSSAGGYHTHPHAHQAHHEAAYHLGPNGQRLPSVDMGIEAIINRPRHRNQDASGM